MVGTRRLFLIPDFHIKSSPLRLPRDLPIVSPYGMLCMLQRCTHSSLFCGSFIYLLPHLLGLEQFDRGEVSPEIAAILGGKGIRLCRGMSRDQEVGEDGGARSPFVAVGAEDLSGKKC